MRLRASFTVEASFIFPIVILLIFYFLSTSINLYEEVKETALDTGEVLEIDAASIFWEDAWDD